MTLDEAKVILAEAIKPDGRLSSGCWYVAWSPSHPDTATLDGEFSPDELEAIAVWMRHGER